jgi:hypothetical protein
MGKRTTCQNFEKKKFPDFGEQRVSHLPHGQVSCYSNNMIGKTTQSDSVRFIWGDGGTWVRRCLPLILSNAEVQREDTADRKQASLAAAFNQLAESTAEILKAPLVLGDPR